MKLALRSDAVQEWTERETSQAIARNIRALRLQRAAQRRQPTIAEMCAGPATGRRGIFARIFGR